VLEVWVKGVQVVLFVELSTSSESPELGEEIHDTGEGSCARAILSQWVSWRLHLSILAVVHSEAGEAVLGLTASEGERSFLFPTKGGK